MNHMANAERHPSIYWAEDLPQREPEQVLNNEASTRQLMNSIDSAIAARNNPEDVYTHGITVLPLRQATFLAHSYSKIRAAYDWLNTDLDDLQRVAILASAEENEPPCITLFRAVPVDTPQYESGLFIEHKGRTAVSPNDVFQLKVKTGALAVNAAASGVVGISVTERGQVPSIALDETTWNWRNDGVRVTSAPKFRAIAIGTDAARVLFDRFHISYRRANKLL